MARPVWPREHAYIDGISREAVRSVGNDRHRRFGRFHACSGPGKRDDRPDCERKPRGKYYYADPNIRPRRGNPTERVKPIDRETCRERERPCDRRTNDGVGSVRRFGQPASGFRVQTHLNPAYR